MIKLMVEKFFDTKTKFSLMDSTNKLKYSNIKCTEKIKALKKYKDSNTFLLEKEWML